MNRSVRLSSTALALFACFAAWGSRASYAAQAAAEPRKITVIHMGDAHGHLVPRPNVRTGEEDRDVGGLARMYHQIEKIRKSSKHSLLINTGDTVQGSAEVLYTRGQAIVDVLNHFGIDAFAPGNWDFVYGTARFKELFAGAAPVAPWNGIAANVRLAATPCSAGAYVLPPYLIKEIDGVRVAILGFTTDRGPQVVGTSVTEGLCFLSSAPGSSGVPDVSAVEAELRNQLAALRPQVDILIVASELGLANNAKLAERNPGIDLVLSSDMHEATSDAVWVTSTDGSQTLLVEEGQDGLMIGEITIKLHNRRITKIHWKPHPIDDRLQEDPTIAAVVKNVRRPFVSGPFFTSHTNPLNQTTLSTPIDTIVGFTAIPLHRSNFSGSKLPAVIEGTSHDFLTDAFRVMTQAEVGAIRGFRYGTHVRPGRITLEDLYHFMPIGAQIAVGAVDEGALRNQMENAADGSLNPDVRNWTGGWLFNFSGLTAELDPTRAAGSRFPVAGIRVNGLPLQAGRTYTYASYWYASDPTLINRVAAGSVRVLARGPDGNPTLVLPAQVTPANAIDSTEVVALYLQNHLGGFLVELDTDRVVLLRPLPAPVFGNSEVQPLRGVPTQP